MRPVSWVAVLLVAAGGVAGAQKQTSATKPPVAGTQKQVSAKKPPVAEPQKPAPAGKPTAHPRLVVPRADTVTPPPVIMREVFTYSAAGRRDPFFPLLNTTELRPALSDLTLAGILQDNSGRGQSVAILKDAASTQYRVRVGSTLGRMRVAAIHRNSVVFLIEEFGASRQDSLVLSDSTTARSQ